MAPPAETREEVDLGESGEIFGSDIYDAPFIHDAIGNVASGDQVTQPGGGVGVKLVVVDGHVPSGHSSLFAISPWGIQTRCSSSLRPLYPPCPVSGASRRALIYVPDREGTVYGSKGWLVPGRKPVPGKMPRIEAKDVV
jgi:hypothetical protein